MFTLGDKIKKVREAKGLSQKQIAGILKMDQAQYSRIENNKNDPSFSNVVRISEALGIDLIELFKADEVFKDINSFNKTIVEKLGMIEQLEEKEKQAFYSILDALISKKKLKDTLTNALTITT
jgi:transcriptional regulator with XRE-family HTH domain